jgi:hypothetical protein
MAKDKKRLKDVPTGRAHRAKLAAEESLKRLREFPRRKERFVATVRESTDRDVFA